jgi:Rieske 2Fe-2S family protein
VTTVASETALLSLLGEQPADHGLPAVFYGADDVHRLDLERIWRSSWVFAAHSCELRNQGDATVLQFGADSFILVRGGEDVVRAFRNTCRHRGSRILDRPATGLKALVCPYHQWTYSTSGRLLGCGGMERERTIQRESLGLHEVRVVEVGGLLFLAAGDDAPSIEQARSELERALRPQGLESAKVAARRTYRVRANWKLIWENNRECWHCHVGHPEYIRSNFDTALPSDPELGRRTSEINGNLSALGLELDHDEAGLAEFPTPDRWWSATRTPTTAGFVSESLDGRAVAPLMGDYAEADVGVLRARMLPNFWCHASSDHAVTTRLLPLGPGLTQVQVTWLVDAAATKGRDYELSRLLPFWQSTSEQDWTLCERAQRGVLDAGYEPGPLSPGREYNVIALLDWYRRALGNTSQSS